VAKKVLVFLTATLFLIFVGLLVIYFYSHKSVNKENDIVNFIPPQTEFVIRIKETAKNTNAFFADPIVTKCFDFDRIRSYWTIVDSVTSRNYKTADIITKNTTYICIDSTRLLMLVDINKKTNDHFIDQFLSNSTNHRKIEKFKEGYKAFFPREGQPMYYFIKHNVMGLSENPDYLMSSLTNADAERTDSLIMDWNSRSNAAISMWGRAGTEASVLDSFISAEFFFNGWIDKLATHYFLEVNMDKDRVEFKGEMTIDSTRIKPYRLLASSAKQDVLSLKDSADVVNYVFSSVSTDSLGKENSFIYTYHQFKDSANNNAQLLISNSIVAKYLFAQVLKDTSVQLIAMHDEQISNIAVMGWETASRMLPIIPITPDTGKLFIALYNDYFLVSNHTLTVLQAVPLINQSTFVKKPFEKGAVLAGIRKLPAYTGIRSELSFTLRDGVMQINCIIKQAMPD
jgi:hypothetical protein